MVHNARTRLDLAAPTDDQRPLLEVGAKFDSGTG